MNGWSRLVCTGSMILIRSRTYNERIPLKKLHIFVRPEQVAAECCHISYKMLLCHYILYNAPVWRKCSLWLWCWALVMSHVGTGECSCRAEQGRACVWAGLGWQCGADSQPADMLAATLTQETDKVNIDSQHTADLIKLRAPWHRHLVHSVENVIFLTMQQSSHQV